MNGQPSATSRLLAAAAATFGCTGIRIVVEQPAAHPTAPTHIFRAGVAEVEPLCSDANVLEKP